MKILLINTPRSPENRILEFAPEAAKPFIHKRLIGPPLGLMTIAAAVKDHDVLLFDTKGEFDLSSEHPSLTALVKKLVLEFRPDIVGSTAITSELYYAWEIFTEAKKIDPGIITVLGGLHPTLLPYDCFHPSVDVVCPGQSPHVFREVVRSLDKKTTLNAIPGILLNKGHGLVRTAGKPLFWDAADADYLMPDREPLKRWISTYKVGGSPFPSTYIFTSLGCPYKCTFCSIWPQFKGKYYQRTVESIISELQLIPDYPVVRFADANTVVDLDFMNTLFDRILEEGIRKTFIMDIRADVASKHPGIIRKMAKGGLKVVICGFESYRDEELKKYRKSSPASDIAKAIGVFHDNDIMIRGNYVIPNDYTEDDFRAIEDYSASNPVVYAGYTILTPMPGTVFYKQVKQEITDYDYLKYNFFNSVMKTALPYEKFHERVGSLWLIKKGKDVI
ncbi:MAG: radical SAM protein [Bacteroidetes bacterium]|nr:radical SAM protein [Bacteroidota bacterium]